MGGEMLKWRAKISLKPSPCKGFKDTKTKGTDEILSYLYPSTLIKK
jgi:hypothetical protein